MTPHCSPEQLVDYVNGELAAAADAEVYLHMADCSFCHDAYSSELSLRESLHNFGKATERELPASLADAIRQAATPQRRVSMLNWQSFWRPRIALPALGGVASLALGVLLLSPHSSGVSTSIAQISAAAFLDRHTEAMVTMPLAEHLSAPTFESAATLQETPDEE